MARIAPGTQYTGEEIMIGGRATKLNYLGQRVYTDTGFLAPTQAQQQVTGGIQEAIAAEAEQRTAERAEARAAVAPAVEAAAALPTEAFTGADIARQQAQAQAQLMGGAAGFAPSPFSGRQQSMAESARMSAVGRFAQIAPQIDLAGRQANIAAQQARAAQMGVVGVGLASALAGVPTTMSPYQAAVIAMQAGQQAGYGGTQVAPTATTTGGFTTAPTTTGRGGLPTQLSFGTGLKRMEVGAMGQFGYTSW